MRSDTQELVLVPWRKLGELAPWDLTAARQELHWGVQVVAALGRTYVAPAADDSHTSLGWCDGHGALAGARVEIDGTPCQAALRLADLTLMFFAGASAVRGELALAGRTLDAAYAWLAATVARETGRDQPLSRPEYTLPPHPLAAGAPFSGADAAARAELALWYDNAHRILAFFARESPEATPVRVWPHHFDLATRLVFAPGQEIGVGCSPGDAQDPEPYWYVTPSAFRDGITLPALRGGEWHANGWFGAILSGSDLVAAGTGPAQAMRLEEFLRSAIHASRALIGLSD